MAGVQLPPPASCICWIDPAEAPTGRLRPEADHRGPLGHRAGQNFIYTHLNRVIQKDDLDMIYLSGPATAATPWWPRTELDGTYTEVYPNITQDEDGMRNCSSSSLLPRRRAQPRVGAGDTWLHQRGRRAGVFSGPRLRRCGG